MTYTYHTLRVWMQYKEAAKRGLRCISILRRSTAAADAVMRQKRQSRPSSAWAGLARCEECGGFTITELAISVTVAGFLATAIFISTFYYYVNTSQAETATTLALDSQSLLMQLTDDIRLSDAIGNTNALSDANAPVGGWVTNNPGSVIIIENPAVNSSRTIIYDTTTGLPYRNEYIYFKSGSNMYKRVLANTAAAGNIAVTSCPQALSGPSCPPDRLFTSSISSLSFTFYDASGATTANASLARSVALSADMAKTVFGKSITLGNSTRVTLRNQ